MTRKILSFAFLFGFFVRVFFLVNTLPAADGYHYLTYARYVASLKDIPLGPTSYQLAEGMYIFRPILGKLILALGFIVFNEIGAKIVLAAFSSAVIFPLFSLIKKLSSEVTAMYAALLWAVLPLEILYTSFGYIDGIMTFFGTLGLYFLMKIVLEDKSDTSLIDGFLAGTFFGLALLVKIAAYSYVIFTLTFLFFQLIRKNPLRMKPLLIMFTTTFLISFWWYLRNIIFFGNIHPANNVSNITNLHPRVFLENLIGVFSVFNGFYLGDIALNVYQAYPLFFYTWLIFAVIHVFAYIWGYIITHKKLHIELKLVLLASLISSIFAIAYQQYYGFTALNFSVVRMFTPFMPIFLILPAKVIEKISSGQKKRKKIGVLLLTSIILVVILGTVFVNCLMRTKFNGYEASTLQEIDVIIPKDSRILSSSRSGLICYNLFPREILSINFGVDGTLFETDPYRALVNVNITYVYYSNLNSPQFSKEIFLDDPRFEVIYFSTIPMVGFLDGEKGIFEAWLFTVK